MFNINIHFFIYLFLSTILVKYSVRNSSVSLRAILVGICKRDDFCSVFNGRQQNISVV